MPTIPRENSRTDVISIYLESTGHALSKSLAVSTVGLPGSFLRLRQTSGQEVLRYRLPFMIEDLPNHKWFNWGPPPPGQESGGPAAVFNTFGKGQSLYVGVSLFQAMSQQTVLDSQLGSRGDAVDGASTRRRTEVRSFSRVCSRNIFLGKRQAFAAGAGVERD